MNEVLDNINFKLENLSKDVSDLQRQINEMPDDRYSAQKLGLVLKRDKLALEIERLKKLKTVLEVE